jgi:predicted NUDIX family NTP pyrophosphohydrolase
MSQGERRGGSPRKLGDPELSARLKEFVQAQEEYRLAWARMEEAEATMREAQRRLTERRRALNDTAGEEKGS